MNKKRWLLLVVSVLCCTMLVACGNRKDKNGSMKADDGRSYGGTIKAVAGDTVETAFFNMTVKKAEKLDTYQFDDGLYEAKDGKTYLLVTLEIENTFEKDLPMGISDFTLNYEGNQSEDIISGYGKADLQKDDFMENIFTLKKGESITKSILFTVDDKKEYILGYTEYYEDEFKGDSFQIQLVP